MNDELRDELKAQKKLRDRKFPFCRHVFFNHKSGKPIKDFRAAFKHNLTELADVRDKISSAKLLKKKHKPEWRNWQTHQTQISTM